MKTQISQEQRDMIARFIAEKGVTKCPPALADGSEARTGLRTAAKAARRTWRATTGGALAPVGQAHPA